MAEWYIMIQSVQFQSTSATQHETAHHTGRSVGDAIVAAQCEGSGMPDYHHKPGYHHLADRVDVG